MRRHEDDLDSSGDLLVNLKTAIRLLKAHVPAFTWHTECTDDHIRLMVLIGVCPFARKPLIISSPTGPFDLIARTVDRLILNACLQNEWGNWLDELCMAVFDDYVDEHTRQEILKHSRPVGEEWKERSDVKEISKREKPEPTPIDSSNRCPDCGGLKWGRGYRHAASCPHKTGVL